MKVVIQESVYEKGKTVFDASAREHGIEYSITGESDEAAMLQYHRQGASCFVIGAKRFSDEFYRSVSEGSVIIRFGVGYNAVPLEICKGRGVKVAYTPGTLTESVAEYTFALLLGMARNIPASDASMKANQWKGAAGLELCGKTIAVIGFGQIGRSVAYMAKYGFSMKVNVYARRSSDKPDFVDRLSDDFAETVRDADIVSLHLATTPETVGFFDAERIDQCKNGCFFINTARGELVVEKDLFEALRSGKIAKAALDVFDREPYDPDLSVDFRKLSNVVLTPHCGSNTKEANERMAAAVVKNILAFDSGGEMTLVSEMRR